MICTYNIENQTRFRGQLMGLLLSLLFNIIQSPKYLGNGRGFYHG